MKTKSEEKYHLQTIRGIEGDIICLKRNMVSLEKDYIRFKEKFTDVVSAPFKSTLGVQLGEKQSLEERIKYLEDQVLIMSTCIKDRGNYDVNYFGNLTRLRTELHSAINRSEKFLITIGVIIMILGGVADVLFRKYFL